MFWKLLNKSLPIQFKHTTYTTHVEDKREYDLIETVITTLEKSARFKDQLTYKSLGAQRNEVLSPKKD